MTLGTALVLGTVAVAATVATGGVALPAVVGAATVGGVAVPVAVGTGGGILSTAATVGLAGSALGPLGTFFFCFADDTEIQKADGSMVKIADLKEGDEVLSHDDLKTVREEMTTTKVTQIQEIDGSFAAHEMIFDNGKTVTATSPHYMIVFSTLNTPSMLIAGKVKVGDVMYCGKDGFSKVVKINDVTLKRKVNVEVESGTLYANGVMTTGVCEDGPESHRSAYAFLIEYRLNHKRVHHHVPTKVAVC